MSKFSNSRKFAVSTLAAVLLAGTVGSAAYAAPTVEKSGFPTGTTFNIEHGENIEAFDIFAGYNGNIDRKTVTLDDGVSNTNVVNVEGVGSFEIHFNDAGEYTHATYTDDPAVASGPTVIKVPFMVTSTFVKQDKGASSSRQGAVITININDAPVTSDKPTHLTGSKFKLVDGENIEAFDLFENYGGSIDKRTVTLMDATGTAEKVDFAGVGSLEIHRNAAGEYTHATYIDNPAVVSGTKTISIPFGATSTFVQQDKGASSSSQFAVIEIEVTDAGKVADETVAPVTVEPVVTPTAAAVVSSASVINTPIVAEASPVIDTAVVTTQEEVVNNVSNAPVANNTEAVVTYEDSVVITAVTHEDGFEIETITVSGTTGNILENTSGDFIAEGLAILSNIK